jgi:hypothetical protein
MFFKPSARNQPSDDRGPAALQDIGQRSLMRMVFTTTGITLGLFSVLQFLGGNYLFASLELALTLLLLWGAWRIVGVRNLLPWIYLYLLPTFSFLLYIMVMPQASQTAFVWVYIIPVLAYLLLGRRRGRSDHPPLPGQRREGRPLGLLDLGFRRRGAPGRLARPELRPRAARLLLRARAREPDLSLVDVGRAAQRRGPAAGSADHDPGAGVVVADLGGAQVSWHGRELGPRSRVASLRPCPSSPRWRSRDAGSRRSWWGGALRSSRPRGPRTSS